ncbi:MAG: PHP domain-containing protein [Euryarchaeota archaeon]|nr:PHP domain-containing protein [Euryarchaeota archaeon]
MKYNLHIHSKYSSDGVLDPEKIVRIAIKRGLNGIAVTDHNTIKGGIEAKKYENEEFMKTGWGELFRKYPYGEFPEYNEVKGWDPY